MMAMTMTVIVAMIVAVMMRLMKMYVMMMMMAMWCFVGGLIVTHVCISKRISSFGSKATRHRRVMVCPTVHRSPKRKGRAVDRSGAPETRAVHRGRSRRKLGG